jgi:AAA family ATP:ADP antiporter
VQQALIFGFGSLAASTPYLAVILFCIIFMWIRAARVLDVLFQEAMEASGASE